MTPPWDCAQQGHHWHQSDGSVFFRHKNREKNTTISVSCCHCACESAEMPVYSKMAPPSADAMRAARLDCGTALGKVTP